MRRLIPLGVLSAAALALVTGCSPSGDTPPGAASPTPSDLSRPAARCPGYPTPACTGVPPGTKLEKLTLTEPGAYRVTEPGSVLDGVHITADLLVAANDVTIKNSRIDGLVINAIGPKTFRYTIVDSTVGPETGCQSLPGVGQDKYTALRLHVRNHGDGFRVGGDDVVIRDSFVRLCSNPNDHSDGIQTYGGGKGLVFSHNTVDQRGVKDITAPIFMTDPRILNAEVTDNLVMGGTYSIQLRNGRGRLVMRGNKLVDGSWVYGPVDSECKKIDWADNTLVTIDSEYRVTSTVGPLKCVG